MTEDTTSEIPEFKTILNNIKSIPSLKKNLQMNFGKIENIYQDFSKFYQKKFSTNPVANDLQELSLFQAIVDSLNISDDPLADNQILQCYLDKCAEFHPYLKKLYKDQITRIGNHICQQLLSINSIKNIELRQKLVAWGYATNIMSELKRSPTSPESLVITTPHWGYFSNPFRKWQTPSSPNSADHRSEIRDFPINALQFVLFPLLFISAEENRKMQFFYATMHLTMLVGIAYAVAQGDIEGFMKEIFDVLNQAETGQDFLEACADFPGGGEFGAALVVVAAVSVVSLLVQWIYIISMENTTKQEEKLPHGDPIARTLSFPASPIKGDTPPAPSAGHPHTGPPLPPRPPL